MMHVFQDLEGLRARARLRLPPSLLLCVPLAAALLGSACEAASRDQRRILVLEAAHGPADTDIRPATRLVLVAGDETREPPAAVWTGALLAQDEAWVSTTHTLLLGSRPNHPVDVDVLPEIAVSPSGALLAYGKEPGKDAGVWLWDGATTRKVSGALRVADRPLFVDERTLVMAGSDEAGIAALWWVRLDSSAPPRQLTNIGLKVGRPFGDSFIPPPADHASMRVEDNVLHWFDGRREQSLSLPVLP